MGARRSSRSSPERSLGAGGSALGQPQAPQAYRLKVDAVAYYLPGKTALGVPVRKGVVAVDPKLIPLGTKLHVPGYGPGLAADVGMAIKGRIIDLWFPSTAKARELGPAHRHDHGLPVAIPPPSAASGTQFLHETSPVQPWSSLVVALAVPAADRLDAPRGQRLASTPRSAGAARAGH